MSILIFFIGCAHSTTQLKFNIASEERIWLDKFFKDLLLEESGIYTLWGSKPMVCFEICLYSSEELKKLQEEIEENTHVEKVMIKNYDFPENWEKWEKIREQFKMSRFLLFKKEDPEEPKLPRVFFINILETALTIQENYHFFKKVVGSDFDSLEVVFEIEKEDSKFWNAVLKNSELMGLLYGFGLKNASCFYWKCRKNQIEDHEFTKSLRYRFSAGQDVGYATIDSLPLPIFSTFFEDDQIIHKYKAEREKIKKIYKNQDFVDVTLDRLMAEN